VYDRAAGKLWAVGPDGTVFDDAAVDALALEVRGARDVPAEDAKRFLGVLTRTLRSQIALYKLQHEDNPPDFARYPACEQLRRRTNRDGTFAPDGAAAAGPDDHFYGPYMTSTPVNPLNGRYKMAVVAGEVKTGQAVPGDYGFVFSRTGEKVYALDAEGRVMPDTLPGSEWKAPRHGGSGGGSGSESADVSMIQTIRSQFALYKLQHNDNDVDLVRYPNWEQLTGRTRVDGTPDPAGKYGPYFARVPVNSRNGSSAVEVLPKVPARYRTSKKVGFVKDGDSGRIWLVDEGGAVMFGQ
jgi:hypothetical protein